MTFGEQLGSLGKQISDQMQKNGVMLARVTNINDPEKRNRVLCKPVTNDNDVAETDWCHCMTPMAGSNYGQFFFPNVDDQVVIAYIGSDIHHPIVLGRYWDSDVKSPYTIQDGANEFGAMRTPTGTVVRFDDVKDKQKVTLTMPSGTVLKLDDENKTITVNDSKQENALTINWEKGEIELKAKTKLTLSAGDTKFVLESSGSLMGQSGKSINLKSKDVALNADTSFSASGQTVEVKSSGTMALQASGTNTIKGTAVNIN